MKKDLLTNLLLEGKSTRDIGKIVGLNYKTISYWINKYGLNNLMKYKKNDNYKFEKIDSKDKAYCLGFILADSAISNKNDVEITVSIKDKSVLEYISKIINASVSYDYIFDKKTRRFPRARIHKRIKDIIKFTGSNLKKERHYPRVNSNLEKYLLLGLFDSDGCITWGYRKDKNRLWHKISFTSSYKILLGVQQYLLKKINISTAIRPKANEDCYVLEFANKTDILKFLNHIYSDNTFIILKRKYEKAKALRLELEENGKTAIQHNTVPSLI